MASRQPGCTAPAGVRIISVTGTRAKTESQLVTDSKRPKDIMFQGTLSIRWNAPPG